MSRPRCFDRDLSGHHGRGAPVGLARSSAGRRRPPGGWRDGRPRWSDAGGRTNRRHADAEESRRARLGLAGESPDESRHAEATLQPRERSAVQRSTDHELHDFQLRSRAVLRSRQAFRLHLVRDAAQHDVVGRSPSNDRGVSQGGSGADGPHARCLRVEHPEGDRHRRARHHRSHGGRCPRGAGRGALLPVSAVRTSKRRRRTVQPDLGRA